MDGGGNHDLSLHPARCGMDMRVDPARWLPGFGGVERQRRFIVCSTSNLSPVQRIERKHEDLQSGIVSYDRVQAFTFRERDGKRLSAAAVAMAAELQPRTAWQRAKLLSGEHATKSNPNVSPIP